MEYFYLLDIPLKYLVLGRNNNNPKYIDDVYKSIKVQGLNKPLVVRDYKINKYEILLGGSRYLALIKLVEFKLAIIKLVIIKLAMLILGWGLVGYLREEQPIG